MTGQPKGLRLSAPVKLGPAIGVLRERSGLSRRALAGKVAAITLQPFSTVDSQLGRYERGETSRPDLVAVGYILAVLGYEVALVPRERSGILDGEAPSSQRKDHA
jgi:transcriptional regulator with XRE-family HTH domain